MTLTTGIKGSSGCKVTENLTARALRSGGARVFATPYLIGLMEEASMNSVKPLLDPGFETVGTRVDMRHLAPSPVGSTVRAESELVAVDGRALTFSVRAYTAGVLVGEGTHERTIVNSARFAERSEAVMARMLDEK